MGNTNVGRIVIAGAAIGIIGIGLFFGLWILLGSLNVETLYRLIISVCVPPAILTVIVILVVLARGDYNTIE